MRARILLLAVFTFTTMAFAGGPIVVGGPALGNRGPFGVDGQPFRWDPAKMPITYRVDPGPMATSGTTTIINNATGIQRVNSMFGTWQAVLSASLSFTNAGALLPAGSYTGGDLKTLTQYNDVVGSCRTGKQSPVVFDADGTLTKALGLPDEIIGYTSLCGLDLNGGFITGAVIVLNGKFQDDTNLPFNSPPNYELTATEFDESITHEIGHFIGLDHSQINTEARNNFPCDLDQLAGLPLMFPQEVCQARKDVGLPTLATDDVSWISRLYPKNGQLTGYGTISGYIFGGTSKWPLQSANVVARLVDDPATPEDESRRVAVSCVSGYRYTGNPGQSITGDNTLGGPNGSRDPQLIGYYEIAVPPGTYTVEVQSILQEYWDSVGPGNVSYIPGENEFWNKDESAFDFPLQRDLITVHAGEAVTDINIVLNSTWPDFDQYEDNGGLFVLPILDAMAEERRA